MNLVSGIKLTAAAKGICIQRIQIFYTSAAAANKVSMIVAAGIVSVGILMGSDFSDLARFFQKLQVPVNGAKTNVWQFLTECIEYHLG